MEKGISPLIAAVILIAMVVAVAGIVGVFFTQFARTTVSGVESGAAAQVSCSGVYIDVVSYNATDGRAIFRNPSGNPNVKINITSASNGTNVNNTLNVGLSGGQLSETIYTGLISTDRIDFFGFCEVEAGAGRASISGSCSRGQSCWR